MPSKRVKGDQTQCSSAKRRSVTGCLTCRRRKKKCDETRPTCDACNRNFLECSWPQNVTNKSKSKPFALSSKGVNPVIDEGKTQGQNIEFNISLCKDAKFVKYNKRTKWIFDVLIVNPNSGAISRLNSYTNQFTTVLGFSSEEEIYDSSSNTNRLEQSDIFADQNNVLSLEDIEHLDLQLDSFPIIEVPTNALVTSFSVTNSQYQILTDTHAPVTKVYEILFQMCKSNEIVPEAQFESVDMEKFLFYACLKGYIPKMTTQYTHPSLTTSATFIPQVEKNPIMKEVFLCCGATYLAWNNVKKFQSMSDELYTNCRMMIRNFISSNENFSDEDWLFGALQLLCNRDKNSLTGTPDDAAWHLVRAFDIIRLRYYGSTPKSFERSIIEDLVSSNLILQPQERTLIESFIFQFSSSILFVQDIRGLPNPFTIFKILNVVLKCPVYNCEHVADWMNNPILGSSLDSFEILAKLSFIGRMPMPLDYDWLVRVAQLRNMCEYYTPATPSKTMDDIQWCNYKINSMVGVIAAKACWLFASKLLDFKTFDIDSPNIQGPVESVLECYKKIPLRHSVWGILPWAVLVTGVFATDCDDQSFILELVEMMADRAHSYNGFKIAAFLRKAWASGNAPNFLFERNMITHLNI